MINSQFEKIRNWSLDRNITHGSTPQAQFIKLVEEVGELASGIAQGKHEVVVDGIGDAVVVLTILAAQHNVSIEQCIEHAWNEIKDRRGMLKDGVWVKESDL
jgi:NTP pyrophosphatase (non-canonical NTP hydrolase)